MVWDPETSRQGRLAAIRRHAEMRARGEWPGGPPPFGWRVGAGRRLVEVPQEQATITRARELEAEGMHVGWITEVLEEEGHTNRSGRPLQRLQVQRMLESKVTTLPVVK